MLLVEQHSGEPAAYLAIAAHEKFWVSFGTIILAAVTLILGAATAFLYLATRALVRGADDTAQRQLRAYISIIIAEATFFEDRPFTVRIVFKNSGKTPAYRVRQRTVPFIGPFPLATFPKVVVGKLFGNDMGPDGAITIGPASIEIPLTKEEIAEFIAGSLAVYAVGELQFVDAFKEARFVRFRLVFRNRGECLMSGSVLPLAHADRGNESN
jgi:hypothetical protein